MTLLLNLIFIPLLWADLNPQAQLNILEFHPGHRSELQLEQKAFIRIDYNSLVPVRFLLKAYHQGKEIERAMRLGPQPLYPEGSGNALAWVSFVNTTSVDQITLETFNESWDLLEKKNIAVQWNWVDRWMANRSLELPDWIGNLTSYQTELTRVQLEKFYHDDRYIENIVMELLYFLFAIYIILQLVTPMRMAGQWRKMSLAPLMLLVPVSLYTFISYSTGSPFGEVLLLITSCLCLFYLVVLTIAQRFSHPSSI